MKTLYTLLISSSLFLFSCEKETMNHSHDNTNFDMKKGKGKTKLDICHTNGQLKNLPITAILAHLDHGDYLFSCNPGDGFSISDIEPTLIEIANDFGGDINKNKDRQDAFEIWYEDYYLTGNWPEEPEAGSGGTAGGGTGGGSLGGRSL